MIVSHDRYFLDRVATHTLAFEDDGGVVSQAGDFGVLVFWKFRRKAYRVSSVLCFHGSWWNVVFVSLRDRADIVFLIVRYALDIGYCIVT